MKLSNLGLSNEELKLIKECLIAALQGPFFEDQEFQTLMGLYRTELSEVINDWPIVDFNDENVRLAIFNSMGQLCGYPHGKSKIWKDYISGSKEEITGLLSKLKNIS